MTKRKTHTEYHCEDCDFTTGDNQTAVDHQEETGHVTTAVEVKNEL